MCNHVWKITKHNEEYTTIYCSNCNTKLTSVNHVSICSNRVRTIGYIILSFISGFTLASWLDLLSVGVR
jgi:hypothetical protein